MFGKKTKSILEMTSKEIKHHSLSHKVSRAVMMLTVVVGLISLIAGGTLYMIPALENYAAKVNNMLYSQAYIIETSDINMGVASEIMKIYNDMTDEERNQVGTKEYDQRFAHITESDEYKKMTEQFEGIENSVLKTSSELKNVYLAGYDADRQRLVSICSTQDTNGKLMKVGEWIKRDFDKQNAGTPEYYIEEIIDVSWGPDGGLLFTGGLPVQDHNENVVCYMMGDLSMFYAIKKICAYLLIYALVLALMVCLIATMMGVHMRRRLVRPLQQITDAAQAYSDDKQNERDITDHFRRLDYHTGDEIERLGLVMTEMEEKLNEYEEDLQRITAEKERLNTELTLASRIQDDMIPTDFPAFPQRDEFDVYASMKPARYVGGDFYSFSLVDEDHLALLIADVSGKGIPAALFMMASNLILRTLILPDKKPSEILERANDIICNNREEMFVTVWLGILEISTGRLIAANAGHEKPVVIHADGSAELIDDKHGFVVGGLEGMKYTDYELQLQPSDQIFVYTDGVPEATTHTQEQFGTERILEAIRKTHPTDPKQVLESIGAAVDDFVGGEEQFDDLTMLCMKYVKNVQ